MGYRSDIAIAMQKEVYKELLKNANDISDEKLRIVVLNLLTKKCAKKKEMPNNFDYIVLYYENIKWYGADVEFLERKLKGKSYDMIIIGEDYNDIKVHYGTDEYLIDLERRIVVY